MTKRDAAMFILGLLAFYAGLFAFSWRVGLIILGSMLVSLACVNISKDTPTR